MKIFRLWRTLLSLALALAFSNTITQAATDGYYQSSAPTFAWDGTAADRFLPEIPGEYQFDYGDDAVVTFNIASWSFPFYAARYPQFHADANGNIWFGAVGNSPVLRAWNTDLNSYFQGGVFVERKINPERVVVQWRSETFVEAGAGRINDVEVVLFENGDIRFDYKGFAAAMPGDAGSGVFHTDGIHAINLTSLYGPVTTANASFALTPDIDVDTDGDGLPDREEWLYGTKPAVADQDQDLRLDGADSNPFDALVSGATPTPLNNDVEFVKQVYRDFLNREADEAGLNYWVGQLSTGARTRAAVVEYSLLSPEFGETVAPVARLYFATYNRIPDYAGLMYWVGEYASGNRTLSAISDVLANSPEFQSTYGSLDNGQFIDLIYANLFSRPPDSEGRAYWVGELDLGNKTRGDVMVLLSDSQEYRDRMASSIYVTMTYVGLFRRAPDQEGFDYWVGLLDLGTLGQEMIALFLTSSEYAARFDGSTWVVPTMTYAFPYHWETVVEDEDENGDGTVVTRYTTDYFYDAGNTLTLTVETYDEGINGSFETKITTSYAYDGNGNPRTVTRSNDWHNDGTANSIWTTSYEIDPFGRVIHRIEAKDYDADGIPEVTLPTLYTWNDDGLLNSQVSAVDGNTDGLIDMVETIGYDYDDNGLLITMTSESDIGNDGIPESTRQAVYSWNGGALTSIITTVDSNGDTAIDWIETKLFGYDANNNLATIVTTIDSDTEDDVASMNVSYDPSGLLVGFAEALDRENDGNIDYRVSVTPTFTTQGMPAGLLPKSADQPLILPVILGLLGD